MKTKSLAFTLTCLLLSCFAVPVLACCPPPQPPCYRCEDGVWVWNCGSGNCCGGSCCSYPCCGSSCCPTDRCCNGACCPSGQICCGGVCCDPTKCCNYVCCPPDKCCVNGTCVKNCDSGGGGTCTWTYPPVPEPVCQWMWPTNPTCLNPGLCCNWAIIEGPGQNASCRCAPGCTTSTWCVELKPIVCENVVASPVPPYIWCKCSGTPPLYTPVWTGTRYICP